MLAVGELPETRHALQEHAQPNHQQDKNNNRSHHDRYDPQPALALLRGRRKRRLVVSAGRRGRRRRAKPTGARSPGHIVAHYHLSFGIEVGGRKSEVRPARRNSACFARCVDSSCLTRYNSISTAGVAEWQTQWSQKPPPARAYRFDSGLRHQPHCSHAKTRPWGRFGAWDGGSIDGARWLPRVCSTRMSTRLARLVGWGLWRSGSRLRASRRYYSASAMSTCTPCSARLARSSRERRSSVTTAWISPGAAN